MRIKYKENHRKSQCRLSYDALEKFLYDFILSLRECNQQIQSNRWYNFKCNVVCIKVQLDSSHYRTFDHYSQLNYYTNYLSMILFHVLIKDLSYSYNFVIRALKIKQFLLVINHCYNRKI